MEYEHSGNITCELCGDRVPECLKLDVGCYWCNPYLNGNKETTLDKIVNLNEECLDKREKQNAVQGKEEKQKQEG